jgi:hypothetical protein
MSRPDSPAKVEKYLAGVDYPASKEELVEAAKRHHAPEEILRVIESLPGERFDAPTAVARAYGEVR